MSTECLKEEVEVYNAKKDELLKEEGKFVLIKGHDVVDVFANYEDALKEGLKRFGNIPFLIHQIQKIESVNFFYHGVAI